tara:strand:- start:164 stop:1423 length:1260 start_codon:yes stop_codon:yes gene_type:complete
MKIVPIAEEGERGVLGSCLIDPQRIGKLILNENDFYHPRHRMLWRSLKELYTNNQTMDIMLLVDYLNKENRLNEVGGESYILNLIEETVVPSHSQAYQDKVLEASELRRVISILEKGLSSLYNWEQVADEVISNLTVESIKEKDEPLHVIGETFIQNCIEGKVGSFDWWCPEWTMKLGKMNNELMIFHAPRSTGKTALMLQWIVNAHRSKMRTPLASIEMLKPELLPRLIAYGNQVNTYVMRTRGHATKDEIQKSKEAVKEIKTLELCIRDKGMSIDDIRGWAISESRNGVDAIFIDNLLSINDGGKNYQSKTIMYDFFIRRLRDLRDELKIPIIILAHPNSEGQVAWSRDVENFADIILYLETVHEPIKVSGNTIMKDYDISGEHVIAKFQKNRQGVAPVASLSFDKTKQTFSHVRWE